MDSKPIEKLDTPTSQPVETIGILNIVFGGLLLICIPCVAGYFALIANLGPFMKMQNKEIQDRFDARQKERLDALAAEAKKAETEEQKASIRERRARVLTEPRPVIATPDFDVLMAEFKDPRVLTYYGVNFGTAMVLNLLMLISGFGLIRFREWGRRMSVGVAWVKLVRLLLVATVSIVVIIPMTTRSMVDAMKKLERDTQAAGAPAADPKEAAEFAEQMAMMSTVYEIGMLLAGSIYPAISLWFLTRPGARAACLPSMPPQEWEAPT